MRRSLLRAATSRSTSQSTNGGVEDYGPILNLAVWLLVGTASLFLALRVFCKISRRLSLWWDDYILVAGWVSGALRGRNEYGIFGRWLTLAQAAIIVSTALQTVCANMGLGKQSHDITQKSFSELLLYSYLAGFFPSSPPRGPKRHSRSPCCAYHRVGYISSSGSSSYP